jgi:hypothetical protein
MSKQIALTKGHYAIVDDADYPMLSAYKWQASERGTNVYASTDINRKKVYMHRMIMDPAEGLTIDHRDGNGLNNQRSNLRTATKRQNIINRTRLRPNTKSKYRGVFAITNSKSWRAQIFVNGKTIYLGSYATEESAALAYNRAAQKHHGDFAKLNVVS